MAADVNNSYLVEKAADYAILSELAYETWHDDGTGLMPNEKVGKWIALYNKGYRVIDFCPNDPVNGFSAVIFQKDNKHILAIRGTTLTDLLDLAADAELATFQMPSGQFESMVKFIKNNNLDQTQFDVTGHSLGGFLAQAAKATFSDRVQDVYTYNAPGALLRGTWDVRSAFGFTGTWDVKDMSLNYAAMQNMSDNLQNKYLSGRM